MERYDSKVIIYSFGVTKNPGGTGGGRVEVQRDVYSTKVSGVFLRL